MFQKNHESYDVDSSGPWTAAHILQFTLILCRCTSSSQDNFLSLLSPWMLYELQKNAKTSRTWKEATNYGQCRCTEKCFRKNEDFDDKINL